MKCICNFETDSFRTLRYHFAANHSKSDFLENFSRDIEENWKEVSRGLMRLYLLRKSDNMCSRCGFNERRSCGSVILEIDHIDGNHQNNDFSNLQVLCPNCHALTPKYRNWNNKGNKKSSQSLRPGNRDYDKRSEISNARKKLLLEKRLSSEPKKKKEDEAMSKLKEMKMQFEDDFKNEVLRLHESGEIDFSKYGWVQLLAERVDEQPQIVGRRVRKLLPNFFVEHCFSRSYNKCRKNKMEWIRPDEEAVLKTAAG